MLNVSVNDDFTGAAVGFARLLRKAGLKVPIDRITVFERSLGVVGVETKSNVYQCARATLVSRPEDFGLFDDCFSAWWEGSRGVASSFPEESMTVGVEVDASEDDLETEANYDPANPDITLKLRFSDRESLREKDFALCSPSELEEVGKAMDKIAMVVPMKATGRKIPSRNRKGALDLRRSVRSALAHQGEPLDISRRKNGNRPRRIVLLCDISGSMEPYARAMIRFLHAAIIGGVRVEAFTFATRLTRVTRELNWKDPDVALARASVAVSDWSGGTRIGESIRFFNDRYGIRGMARQSIIVVMSDGWDRGDSAVLAREMARLARVAQKIVWVNPLKYTPGYAPIARGMAAALPYVDAFIEGHSLGSLEKLAEVIAS